MPLTNENNILKGAIQKYTSEVGKDGGKQKREQMCGEKIYQGADRNRKGNILKPSAVAPFMQ